MNIWIKILLKMMDVEAENSRLKKENLELLNYMYELLQDNRRLRGKIILLTRK